MNPRITRRDISPRLDLDKFATDRHLGALDAECADRLMSLWRKWTSRLHALVLDIEAEGYAAIWLDDEVGDEVARLWDVSPSFGYIADALAGELCMAGLRELAPEVERAGCAALAEPTESASRFLRESGARINEQSRTLDCRYGILTHYPYKGRCGVCSLRGQCSLPGKIGMPDESP